MLSGVLFEEQIGTDDKTIIIQPHFVNRFIITDLFASSIPAVRRKALSRPLIVSISTLVSPFYSTVQVLLAILRSLILVVISWLPGQETIVKKISVANTSILYHDGRALATCESGPPMHIALPGLETVGWWNGSSGLGEPGFDRSGGLVGFFREWTTAHVSPPLHLPTHA